MYFLTTSTTSPARFLFPREDGECLLRRNEVVEVSASATSVSRSSRLVALLPPIHHYHLVFQWYESPRLDKKKSRRTTDPHSLLFLFCSLPALGHNSNHASHEQNECPSSCSPFCRLTRLHGRPPPDSDKASDGSVGGLGLLRRQRILSIDGSGTLP